MPLGRLGKYEVLERLGQGGMGVVYLAHDVPLDRLVALKLLFETLALEPSAREHLLGEARSEARVNHPSVTQCYEIGEALPEPRDLFTPGRPAREPLPYIAMEYVPGTDLAAILHSGPLTLARVLDIAMQMAEGLDAAHRAGLVHRDIKPANVRVTPEGRVKICDFGLARMTRPVRAGSREVTQEPADEGLSGTWQYMAPEQVTGGRVDARSDLYAFGVVLFEMVSGRRPFGDDDLPAHVYSLANHAPPSLASVVPAVPAGLDRLVSRMLSRSSAGRPASAHAVREALVALIPHEAPGPGVARARRVFASPRAAIVIASVLVVAGAVWPWLRSRLWPTAAEAGAPSIAVLRFVPEPPDSALGRLGAGLAVDVAAELSERTSLDVVPPAEVLRVTSGELGPTHSTRELGARTTLTGVLRRAGGAVRLDVRLAEADSGHERWAAGFDFAPGERFAVRNGIVDHVAAKLGAGGREPAKAPEPSPEAYEAYLLGVDAMNETSDPTARDRAARALERSVTLAPDFALGWATRGRALLWLWNRDHDPTVLREAESCVDHAVRLDAGLLQARVARARLYRDTGRAAQAVVELQAVVRERPAWDDAWTQLGGALQKAGDVERAEDCVLEATRLRPGSPAPWTALGNLRLVRGNTAAAREAYERVVTLTPDRNRGYEGVAAAWTAEGRWSEALAVYHRLPQPVANAALASNIATAYFFSGSPDGALPHYLRAVSLEPNSATLRSNLGDCYLRLGRRDDALGQYRKAVELDAVDLRAAPGDPQVVARSMLDLAKAGESARAWAAYRERASALPAGDAELHHTLAKAMALAGHRREALDELERMRAAGGSLAVARTEDEFAALRDDPEYRELVTAAPPK